ncbi:hypothetical protein DIZ81_05100 [Legionella taurinensis]|uniref:F-box domain-containing protein n=1 Tax=Legionella taurinensis TaxID=70611 RepID=A0AB38N8V2_9GAMM|nr:F-box protein [Legionella taurinensis]MDX1837053.1 hypothetical protein [Legionella taurinensis]PUT41456.1 hypothetical protein DB744_05100 [Legionella taurinensis]PUT42695.1 hypothetical protein DB746_07435 [Legionella taurinensis]PUT46723.1 hypothetical protein DB743_04835 [Legionella taurinensis]PUT47372.1 hypothetical protein DB745_08515 [Legionella taurinensis]
MTEFPNEVLLNILRFTSYREKLRFSFASWQSNELVKEHSEELSVLKQLFNPAGYSFGGFSLVLERVLPFDVIKFHLIKGENGTSTTLSKSDLPLIVKLIANQDEQGLIKQFDNFLDGHIKKSFEQKTIIREGWEDSNLPEIDFSAYSLETLKP